MRHYFPFVSQARYSEAQAELARLRARILQLEDREVRNAEEARKQAVDLVNSVLRKNQMALIGGQAALLADQHEMGAMQPVTPTWSPFDHKVFNAWARSTQEVTGATRDDMLTEYRNQYGDALPSTTLV